MMEVLDDEEAGPSKAQGKHKASMPIHMGASARPVTWSQVMVLKLQMHNTIGQMWVMEVDIPQSLGG